MRSLARSSLPKARIILVRENSNLKAFLVAKIYLVSFFHRSLISKLFNHYFRLYRFLETGTRPFPGPFEFASKIPLHSIEIESIFAERRNLERNREPLRRIRFTSGLFRDCVTLSKIPSNFSKLLVSNPFETDIPFILNRITASPNRSINNTITNNRWD